MEDDNLEASIKVLELHLPILYPFSVSERASMQPRCDPDSALNPFT
jgi:hypothetical protein